MNVNDLIARAKALYMIITDPTVGYFKKLRAIGEFLSVVLPLFGGEDGQQPMFAAPPGLTAEQALADLEALGTGEGMAAAPLQANGEWVQKVLALLAKLWPLIFSL